MRRDFLFIFVCLRFILMVSIAWFASCTLCYQEVHFQIIDYYWIEVVFTCWGINFISKLCVLPDSLLELLIMWSSWNVLSNFLINFEYFTTRNASMILPWSSDSFCSLTLCFNKLPFWPCFPIIIYNTITLLQTIYCFVQV